MLCEVHEALQKYALNTLRNKEDDYITCETTCHQVFVSEWNNMFVSGSLKIKEHKSVAHDFTGLCTLV